MESISAHALLAIFGGYGVGGSLRRHGLVKDRVEAGVVPSLGKSLHHFADQGDRRGIVQRGKDYRLLQILEYLIGDSLVPVQSRPGMHHAVAHRVDHRHSRPQTASSNRSTGSVAAVGFGGTAQLLPVGIAKGELQLRSAHSADLAGEQGARPRRPGPAWPGALAAFENGKLDRRRTAIDYQNVHSTTQPPCPLYPRYTCRISGR